MVRLLTGISALLLFASMASPIHAAEGRNAHREINWSRRDTAVYVVSTLNVIHLRHGRSLVHALETRDGASRFTVLSDVNQPYLFFIRIEGMQGRVVGALVYEMGWKSPRAATRSIATFGVRMAPRADILAYRADSAKLIGSFSTTRPW